MMHPNLIFGTETPKKGKKNIFSKSSDLLVCADKLKACINSPTNKSL